MCPTRNTARQPPKTLEYAYDDFCGYQLAGATGNTFYKNIFARQMYNYKNVYDPATRFMRGKNAAGEWNPDFDPVEWGGPFTEGNAWHWEWSVFHDVQGLINLAGAATKLLWQSWIPCSPNQTK